MTDPRDPNTFVKGRSGAMYHPNDLLDRQQLADALQRSTSYIRAMRYHGFEMPGNMATLTEAREWLRAQGEFSSTRYFARWNESLRKHKPRRRALAEDDEPPAGKAKKREK